MEHLARWGIEPVPPEARRLGFWDFAVLWGDLGIGLLVLLAGSFLVPALSLPQALLAILLGSLVGVALLAVAGIPGSQAGTPTMVCLRPALGVRGSYLPTALNVLQLLGWTVFELVVMAHAASAVSRQVLGVGLYPLWVLAFGGLVLALGLWGPLAVIRRWLSRFAVWLVLATTAWLLWALVTRADVGALWRRPGAGGLSWWAAVDLVIAMPVSWVPLVADYSRFARRPAAAAWGTAVGYFLANVSFYSLGALVLLAAGVSQEPKGFVEAVALIAGPLALLILLADETDEAWADLYSCAVSVQNVLPRAPLGALVTSVGAICTLAALLVDVTRYEAFLLLIGSVFVPLFGVLAADYFAVRGRYEPGELVRPDGRYRAHHGVNWAGMAAWAAGVVLYLALAGRLAWVGVPGLPAVGASLPSLLVGAGLYLLLARLRPGWVEAPARRAAEPVRTG